MGSINSKGVYEYTEDDVEATASAMLNKQAEALTASHRRAAAGAATLGNLPASTATDLTVNFPAGRFTAAPRVVATLNTPVAWVPQPAIRVLSRTATGFVVSLWSSAARTNVAVDWVAVQE